MEQPGAAGQSLSAPVVSNSGLVYIQRGEAKGQ